MQIWEGAGRDDCFDRHLACFQQPRTPNWPNRRLVHDCSVSRFDHFCILARGIPSMLGNTRHV